MNFQQWRDMMLSEDAEFLHLPFDTKYELYKRYKDGIPMNFFISELQDQKRKLESQGYKVAYIALYGSQNYGLEIYNEEYQSDIDMKAVIVPTLDDLITNSKPVSMVLKTENGECDVKDIRSYLETLLKANPAYVETLFTNYFIIDDDYKAEFEEIRSLRNNLVYSLRAQFIRAIYGMMCEKEKALCHPYPSIVHKIEKYGYDGKQAHHIRRLQILMVDYFKNGKELSECFFPPKEEIPYLLKLKLNRLSLYDVTVHVSEMMNDSKEFKDLILSEINESTIDYSIKSLFVELSQNVIKNKIIGDFQSNNIPIYELEKLNGKTLEIITRKDEHYIGIYGYERAIGDMGGTYYVIGEKKVKQFDK